MMEKIDLDQGLKLIQEAKDLTFLTGAGVSTPSGIPDYRSLNGVYHGIEEPEYLLSLDCLNNDPEKFYGFIKHLYHPKAKPNVIHQKIAALEKVKTVQVVTQNIDHLHSIAGSQKIVNFHGNLYDCYCRKCGKKVPWQEYLQSDRHSCGGQIRPNIVLYGEGLDQDNISRAVKYVEAADLVVIAGTSFQVHPFCDLIYYKNPQAKVLVINQDPIPLSGKYYFYEGNAADFFKEVKVDQ